MKKRTKVLVVIGALSFMIVAFLISIKSYFNNREIALASDGCYEIGGMPEVQGDFLNLNYSFSCQKGN